LKALVSLDRSKKNEVRKILRETLGVRSRIEC
jgi:hypothetical protein